MASTSPPTIERISRRLGFGNDKERFYAWAGSDRVKPAWLDFYFSQAPEHLEGRGLNKKTMLRICRQQLIESEHEYDDMYVTKEGWGLMKHGVRFVLGLVALNRENGGLWALKSVSERNWMCEVAYQVLQVIRRDHHQSRISSSRLARVLVPPPPKVEKIIPPEVKYFILEEQCGAPSVVFALRRWGISSSTN